MTDLKRIKLIEEKLGVKLTQVKPEEIRTQNNCYCLNMQGDITGLAFNGLPYKHPLTDVSFLNELKNLTTLNLSDNQLTDVSFLKELKNLTTLDLNRNQLTNIPELKELKTLVKLDLSYNKLMDASGLKELKKLVKLNLQCNRLIDVLFLSELTQITTLYLGNNQLTNTSGIRRLKGIIVLGLNHNQLTDISEISELKEITRLNLCGNQLTDISALKELTKITVLDLSDNKLVDVSDLKIHKKMTWLNLNNNLIKNIFCLPNFSELQAPNYLLIDNNPVWDKVGILLKGNENHLPIVRDFLSRQKEKTIKHIIILPQKVLFLGNHATGKSTLLHYIMDETISNKIDPTHILAIKPYPPESELPEIIFYDFGGQDFYHGIYQVFLSTEAIYLILYHDDANKNAKVSDSAGLSIRHFNLKYWLGQKNFFEYKAGYKEHDPVLLVRTHADKEHKKSGINCNHCEHNIHEDFNLSLAKTYEGNISDARKSAYSQGLEYFKSTLLALAKEKAKHRKEPRWYITFLKYIYSKWQSNEQKYVEVASLSDKFTTGDIKVELEQLHRTGLVFYYRGDPDLEDVVWLNPHAVIEHVHDDILSKKRISGKEGQLKPKDIEKIDPKLIKLLQNQKVIFRHDPKKDKDDKDVEYIIPNYLPLSSDNQGEYDLLTFGFIKPDFTLRFRHFLPFGLINQMICFFGKQPDKKMFWRDQLLFTLGGKEKTDEDVQVGDKAKVTDKIKAVKDAKNDGEAKVLINLDFSKMVIKVYCARHVNAQASVEKLREYLFFSMLSLYWSLDLEPLAWDKFINPDPKVKNDSPGDSLAEKTPNYKLEQWNSLRWEEKYRPDDLYISLDSKSFIKYRDLFAENDTNKINAYRIEKDGHDMLGEDVSTQLHLSLFQAFNPNGKFNKMKNVFISYSHDDIQYRLELQKFLINPEREGLIEIWQDGMIEPGTDWDKAIKTKIETADIIIMLISQSFIASNYVHEVELKKALEKALTNEARIIPILLSSCDWKDWKAYPSGVNFPEAEKNKGKISKFQFMPLDDSQRLIPLNKWPHPEDAWQKVVDFIRTFSKSN